MEPIRLSGFASEIQEWARHICGKLEDSFKEGNIINR